MISRRQFMRRGAVAAAVGLAATTSFAFARARRPNIVFILTDDQRWDAMSCAGHPFLKTPNMDRIRNEGALFENAFVTTSICSPSRASFLTGTYAHMHGVMTNDENDFDAAKTPPFTQLLSDGAGYETAYIGKWHMDGTRDDPRPGYGYWLSFKGQGVYNDPVLNVNGDTVKEKGYITDILTDYAVQWIEANHDKPFCLYLSHKAVHEPFTPPERHKDIYAEAIPEEPPAFNDSLETKPKWQRALASREGVRYRSRNFAMTPVPDKLPPREWEPYARQMDYIRAVQAVDEGIGRIFDVLEKLGQLDNTVIMLAGDNGYFWGEHRRTDKRLAYEDSIRIPLVMRHPPTVDAGTTVREMALNIDVAPTLLDLCGVDPPDWMQGRSMVPLFKGDDAAWRKSFLYEYWIDLKPAIPRMLGVRTEKWKYLTYPDIDDIGELYDLDNDPHEMVNLISNPKYAERVREMDVELKRLMVETEYAVTQSDDVVAKPQGLMLDLSFDAVAADIVRDMSGHGNDGAIEGARLVAGRDGKALELDGFGHVAVDRSDSLDPANCTWVVEAWVKPAGDGAVVVQGGESRGYMLFIEDGVPGFAVSDGGTTYIADARERCVGRWTHLVGIIEPFKASIYVDGTYIDSIPLPRPIHKNPNESFQIGRDVGSAVDKEISRIGFKGLVERVRVYRGRVDVKQLYE